ncbi:hypothetical protein BJ508DRAFT_95632 [Ascobolus immersus RN42]|uniref:Uncharacterized protein n=1 Tax=Ascobolus immersus RN42 TaxID=1160509 RepID=A0A3N4ILR0_ASCIM|nr:hypothetical protein BJ508DRAFT_95632 [Ascobolus immersus RN42]
MNLPSPPLKIHQPKASSPNSPAVLTSSTIFGGPGLNSISSWEHFSNEPNYDLSPNPNKPPPPPGPPPAPAAAPPPPPPPAAAQPKPKQDESPHKAHSKPVQAAGGMAAAYASTPPPPPKIPHSIQSPPAFLKNDHSIDGRIGSPLGARPPITPSGSMQEYPSRLAEQVERPASTKIPPAPQFVNYSPTRLKDSRQDDQHIAPHDNHSVTSPSAEPSYKKFGVPLPYAGSPKPRDSPKQKPKTLVSEAVQTDPYRSPSPPPKPKPKMRDMSTNTETEKNRWQALDDLDKFYISSVRRFIAMVRSEDAADSDQERMELFNEFFEHERIVRATRYGIAIKTPTPPPAITVEPLKIKKVHPNLGDGIANAAHLVVESAKSTPGGVSLGEEQSFNFADLQVPLNTPIGDDIKKRFSALADEVDDDVEIVTANVASGGRAHSMMISADDPAVKEHKRKVSQLQLRDAYKRPEHVRTISQQPQQVTVEKRPEHQRSKSHQHPPAPEKKAEHQRTESLAPNYQPFQPGISKVASPPMSPTVDGRKRSPSYVAFTPGAKKLEVPSRGSSPAASPSSADEKRERRNSLYKPYQAPPGHEKRRSMTTVPTTSPAGRRASMILNDLSGEPKQYEAFSPGRSPGRSPRSPARGNSPSGYAAYPGGRPTPQKRMSLSPSRAAAIQPLFGQSKTPQPVGSKPVIPFTPPKSKTPQPGAGLPYPTSDDAFKPKLGPAFQPPKSKTPYPEEENGLKMPQTGPMQLAILPLVQQDSEFEPVITPPEENRSISPMLAPPVNNSPLKSSRPARAMTVPPQEMDAVSVPSRPSTQKPVEKAVVPPPVELDIKPLVPQMPPVPPLNVFLPPSDRILPNKSAMEEVERNVLSIGTDFSALEELVKNFEKTALQKRIANDKARRARSDEHEEDCDRLFAEGKIEYFELTEMDAAFKKEENGKKEEEELQEYDLYIDTVYDPTVRELKRRLAVLEHQHHELLPILQAARMGRDAFDPKVPGILLTEGLPLLLHTVQLVETHHERLNQALIARDKKYRRMRTLILQIHSQTKEIRALNATLDLAERETTLRAITAHHSRIEVLNDELEAYVFSGIDRNIAFQDDLDVAVKNCLRFTDALSEQDKEDLKRVARIIRELEGINHHVMELLRNSLLRVVIAEAALEKAKVRVEALGEGKGLVSEEARKVLDTVKVGLK